MFRTHMMKSSYHRPLKKRRSVFDAVRVDIPAHLPPNDSGEVALRLDLG